jgi:hypothetical protein
MSKVIVPAVSRHVWFYPDREDSGVMMRRDGQPLHAVVIFVINERTVNLAITDHDGFFHTRIAVALVQPGDELPGGSYATWMPFQVKAPEPAMVAGDAPISPILADLIATTPTSLKPDDLAGIKVGADMTPAQADVQLVDGNFQSPAGHDDKT